MHISVMVSELLLLAKVFFADAAKRTGEPLHAGIRGSVLREDQLRKGLDDDPRAGTGRRRMFVDRENHMESSMAAMG